MDRFIKKWRMENAPIPPPNIDIDDIEVNVPIDIQPPNLDLDVHVVPNPNIDVLIDLQPIENPSILDDDDVNERGGSSSKRGYEENDDNVEVEQLLKRSHIEHASVEIGSSSRPSTPSPFVTCFVEDVDLANLAADPGLRIRILDYHPNKREEVRRAYLLKGPCQPKSENFPQIKIGNDMRSFNNDWYTGHEGWLECSADKNALFCLYCYLFRPDKKKQGGGSVWVKEGFRNFEQKVKLNKHVGKVKSLHNQAYMKCQDLLNQKQHLETLISRQSNEAQRDYRIHLTAVMKAVKFLLKQGLAFRGNDESPTSKNKGNYLELMDYTEEYNEELKMVRRKAPENLKLISSDIQKDMVNAAAVETTNAILADHGNALFSIMIDEARDVSIKEQMALVLRYVDKQGCVVERFVGVVHVLKTNAMALKSAIDALFSKYNLNIMRLRGQGYDGASNMQGDLNGLKALILRENPYAFFIHCFAHQLQLALIAVAKKKAEVACVFNYVAMLVNVVGASCKRRDMLREKCAAEVVAAFENGEISSGQGLNQETSLKRSGDTRWGSHYATLVNLILMFTSVLDVLVEVKENGLDAKQRGEANDLLDSILKFDFILGLHFMKNLLGISNDLSKALQKKDQDIVNAMSLVKVCKMRIQMMRDNGWDPLLAEISLVCAKHNVFVPKMEDAYIAHRPKKGAKVFTNLHHYRDLFFYESIAWQSNELDNRFNEVNTELLLCMACLCPRDSFVAFNKEKLIRFAEFYPLDFTPIDLMVLSDQLETYVMDVRSSNEFLNLNGIGDLAKKMVETRKNIVFPLVYLLVTLALILPVSTASVERAFSPMQIVKSRLRNRMGDELLNDYLVTYIEREFFDNIEDEAILQRFQNMKPHRGQL